MAPNLEPALGEHNVDHDHDAAQLRTFTQHLLNEVRAFQRMWDEDRFETGVRRIGVEQELFLVDSEGRPAPKSIEVLERVDDDLFTTELGRFNLEFNLDPLEFGGNCLSQLESDLNDNLSKVREAARSLDVGVVLTGILPTLRKSDLTLGNMTPVARYFALNEAMNRLRGEDYQFRIQGRDELIVRHDNVMLESCNTSFQIHFQVAPAEFVRFYNIAQVLAAPVLAAAVNSPMLFGRQLWQETRIALFEQSVDTRGSTAHLREQSPRVSFGRSWVEDSAIEIFQEDISRFRVILQAEIDEDPFKVLDAGGAPSLRALRLHNGTVYRWNRPCYGISDGLPHLRIENRVVPAGPSVLDEVANAAFWFGLMSGMLEEHEDIREAIAFDVARGNFVAAARLGLNARLDWPGRGSISVADLILQDLLPLARSGLERAGVDSSDVDRYLGTLQGRIERQQTGAQWMIDTADQLRDEDPKTPVSTAIVALTLKNQESGDPVHAWATGSLEQAGALTRSYRTVEQLMSTDLFTVNEEDVVDMVAAVMKWKHVRRIPVEDNQHRLVGLVTYRSLLQVLSENLLDADAAIPVREIMKTEVVTTTPETPALDAVRLMQERKIGCLPVVDDAGRLVGIITEHDFMEIARPLLREALESNTL